MDAFEQVRTDLSLDQPRRVHYGDLTDGEFSIWFSEKLRKRYPNVREELVLGMVRGYTEVNDCLFLRYQDAIGLAQLVRQPFCQPLRVEILFVFRRSAPDGRDTIWSQKQALDIYRDILRWAESIGASEILFDQNSDVPVTSLKELGVSIGNTTFRRHVLGSSE